MSFIGKSETTSDSALVSQNSGPEVHTVRDGDMLCVGLFLHYRMHVVSEGEGIGRFVVRLVSGLLQKPNVMIYMLTSPVNQGEISKMFSVQTAIMPQRIEIRAAVDVATATASANLPVDVWIVPYVGLESAIYLRQPSIVCLHDLIHRHFPDLYGQNTAYVDFFRNVDKQAQWLAHQADAFVFSSEFTRQHDGLKFLGLRPDATHVVKLAAPTEEYSVSGILEEADFRNQYQLFGEYLVFPSMIRLHKNHDRLLSAFLQFRRSDLGRASGLKLVFTDKYEQSPMAAQIGSVMSKYREAGLQDSVVFLGRLPPKDMPSLYKYARGTVVPTLFEGSCPFPILESLSVGTAVAASDLAVAREVVGGVTSFLWFDPYSVTDMAEVISKLWIGDGRLGEVQHSASAEALARTWADVADEYYELLVSVIKKRSQG